MLVILLIVLLAGCATAGRTRQLQSQVDDLESALRQQQQIIVEQDATISQRESDLKKLQLFAQEKDKLLREKEERIIQLRKRLEGFGVFE